MHLNLKIIALVIPLFLLSGCGRSLDLTKETAPNNEEISVETSPTEVRLNQAPATTTVHYIDFKNGFEVDLPYYPTSSSSVGYEATSTTLEFGPFIQLCEGGCGSPKREYELNIFSYKSSAEIERDIQKIKKSGGGEWFETKKLSVNGRVVYYYSYGGMCQETDYILAGEKNMLEFRVRCGDDEGGVVLDVIKSIKFFDPDKILIDAHNYHELNKLGMCYPGFTKEKATQNILYLNKEKEISFSVPYNPNWRLDQFVLAPYFDLGTVVEFGEDAGPPPESGCDNWFTRRFSLSFIPQSSSENIVKETNAKINHAQQKIITNKKVINGLDVLEVTVQDKNINDQEGYGAWCREATDVYVFGKKYNYLFNVYCFGTATISEVEEVIKTMKLIN